MQLGYEHLIYNFKKEIKPKDIIRYMLPESVNHTNYKKFFLWNEFCRLYNERHLANEMDHIVMGSASQFMN